MEELMIEIERCRCALAKAELQTIKAREDLRQALGKITVACTDSMYGSGCGVEHEIKNLTYIQTHFYIKPYGCTGGDYYREGEGQFICPACGHRNRLYTRPEIQDLKPAFGKIVDEYTDT